MRTFQDIQAKRERVPLLIGLVGPSGSGKTYSALRLAAGIREVVGGETFVIDTEARRALHYADQFSFRHVEFQAPFSPDDYGSAIEHCVTKGATTIVIDSMSHEHEGPGGVLEMHDKELDRIAGSDLRKRERCNMLAWAGPKQARQRLVNRILQIGCNFVFCFRAKEKIKMPGKGEKDVTQLGWMPIADDAYVYEMTLRALLTPGCNGVPTWRSDKPGEQKMIKLPGQLRDALSPTWEKNLPLDESMGEALAKWAGGQSTTRQSPAGDAQPPSRASEATGVGGTSSVADDVDDPAIPYGKNKGVRVSELKPNQLEWYRDHFAGKIDAEPDSRFTEEWRTIIAAIDGRIAPEPPANAGDAWEP